MECGIFFRNKDDSIITIYKISKKADIKNMILFIKLKNRHTELYY